MRQDFRTPPKQTTPYSVTEYLRAGCGQFKDGMFDVIALGLHGFTGGLMCNGCPQFRNRCGAYAKLVNATPHISRPEPVHTETVREEAKRRGISIGEVRRQRHAASGAA